MDVGPDAFVWPDLAMPDYACDEILTEDDPEPCELGQLLGPDGRCGETWECPDGWVRAGDYGCRPPPLPDCAEGSHPLPDGTCLEPWPCPEDGSWVPIDDGLPGCKPPPLADCPEGSMALTDGTCSPVWQCPPGWHRPEGARGCAPREICTDGVPGPDGTCRPLEFPPCPADRWGALTGLPGAIFVDPAAGPFGDGSPERPLAHLEPALERGAGRTLVLAAGTYRATSSGHLQIPADTHVVGVCHQAVLIEGPVRLAGDRASLRMATIEVESVADELSGVGLVADADRVQISHVAITGGWAGTYVNPGARLMARTVSLSGQSTYGIYSAGMVDAQRVRIANSGAHGVVVGPDGEGTFAEMAAVSLKTNTTERDRVGLVTFGQAWLAHVHAAGWQRGLVVERTGRLNGERLAVVNAFDAHENPAGRAGRVGFWVDGKGRASLRDVFVGGEFSAFGLVLGSLRAERLLAGGRRGGNPLEGFGLGLSGIVDLVDIEVFDVPNRGIIVDSPIAPRGKTRVTGLRLHVHDIYESIMPVYDPVRVGIEISGPVHVELSDTLVERVPKGGIVSTADRNGYAPTLRLNRARIREIFSAAPQDIVGGLVALGDQTISGRDIQIAEIRDVGALIMNSNSCDLTRLSVNRLTGADRSRRIPIGLLVMGDGRCTVQDARIASVDTGIQLGKQHREGAEAGSSGHISASQVSLGGGGARVGVQAWQRSSGTLTDVVMKNLALEVGDTAGLAVKRLVAAVDEDIPVALYATERGSLSIDEAWMQVSSRNGILADTQARVDASRATVIGSDGVQLVLVIDDGHVRLRDMFFDEAHRSALSATGASTLELTRVAVRDAETDVPAMRGRGQIRGLEHAVIGIDHTWLTRTVVSGISASGSSRVFGRGVTITTPAAEVTPGVLRAGVLVSEQAVVSLDRLDVDALPGRGVAAIVGGRARLSGIRIVDWQEPTPSDFRVGGLIAESEGSIEAYGLHTSGGTGAGVIAADASITLHGARIGPVEVQLTPGGEQAHGIVSAGGPAELRAVRVEGRHGPIVHIDGGRLEARCLRADGGTGPAIRVVGSDTDVDISSFYAGRVDGPCVLADGGEVDVILDHGTLEMCSTCTLEAGSAVIWSGEDVVEYECR